jgi:hypothetical protein
MLGVHPLSPGRPWVLFVAFTESVDDEDEIMIIVCEQMANFVPLVGGGAFAFCLLPVYEAIASGEEVALRQLAIDGLSKLVPLMPASPLSLAFACPLSSCRINLHWRHFADRALFSCAPI